MFALFQGYIPGVALFNIFLSGLFLMVNEKDFASVLKIALSIPHALTPMVS